MITSFGKSDVGLKRSHNEEAFVTGDDGGLAVVADGGDSRTYLFKYGKLKQITKDHSLAEEQRDQGLITDAEARNHPHRHSLSNHCSLAHSLII